VVRLHVIIDVNSNSSITREQIRHAVVDRANIFMNVSNVRAVWDDDPLPPASTQALARAVVAELERAHELRDR
jgi:hypothetical protein